MDRSELTQTVLDEIDRIAPGSMPDELDLDADMRDMFDLDSMDILNLVAALHERLAVEIPEADLDQLISVNAAVAYLERRLE